MALITWAGGTILEAPRTALRLEDGGHTGAEASTLGLAPGEWPTLVQVRGRDGRLVTFRNMGLHSTPDGDVAYGHYTALGGRLVLTIYND
jgi:hypothetical protein